MTVHEARQLQLPAAIIRTRGCPQCAGWGTLEATDMFCGAGGSSLGLENVRCWSCGRQLIVVTQAINHWALAVDAHNANFPEADHDVHDVDEIPARRFRRTPLFWASPECVNHTDCKGKKDDSPEAQRSRATFKDIVRFTAHHRYDAIFVENVVEARKWCEHEDCACGAEFNAWYRAMTDLGYEGKIVYFNSQFALPTPQSRDRMYVIFWRIGVPAPNLRFRPSSWCKECQEIVRGVQAWKKPSRGSFRSIVREWGRYGANYTYTCPNEGCGQRVYPAVVGAKTIIDRSLPISRIGDRTFADGSRRDLAPATRKRIKVGWENIGARRPMAVQVGGNTFERDGYARVWALDWPIKTITTTNELGLVTTERTGDAGRDPREPVPTVSGKQTSAIVIAGGQHAMARATDEPCHAVLGSDRLALVVRTGGQAPAPRSSAEPTMTITGQDRQIGLVVQAGGPTGSGRNPRAVGEPLGAVMPQSHAAFVMANMTNNVPTSTEQPVGAVTSGDRHYLVQVSRGGGAAGRVRDEGEPLQTVAGHGEIGLVELRNHGGIRHPDEPAHTVIGNHHGMLVYAGVPGWVHEAAQPAGVVTSRDHHWLLQPTAPDPEPLVVTEDMIDDCYFRMLHWTELLRAQAMHVHGDGRPYLLTARCRDRKGRIVELSNEKRTKMIGNAVSSPVATMLGYAVMEALAA